MCVSIIRCSIVDTRLLKQISTGNAYYFDMVRISKIQIFLFTVLSQVAWAADQLPGSGVGHSAGAGSPFTNYDAKIVIYTFLAAFLVFTLLGGAFVIINLGLLSKRPEDKVGHRSSGDLGFFKNEIWPPEPYERVVLPAEEQQEETLPLDENKKSLREIIKIKRNQKNAA